MPIEKDDLFFFLTLLVKNEAIGLKHTIQMGGSTAISHLCVCRCVISNNSILNLSFHFRPSLPPLWLENSYSHAWVSWDFWPKAMQDNIVKLTKFNFDDNVKRGAWFVKFYAPWCTHCQRRTPQIPGGEADTHRGLFSPKFLLYHNTSMGFFYSKSTIFKIFSMILSQQLWKIQFPNMQRQTVSLGDFLG